MHDGEEHEAGKVGEENLEAALGVAVDLVQPLLQQREGRDDQRRARTERRPVHLARAALKVLAGGGVEAGALFVLK